MITIKCVLESAHFASTFIKSMNDDLQALILQHEKDIEKLQKDHEQEIEDFHIVLNRYDFLNHSVILKYIFL